MEPKTPEDIYKSHLENSRPSYASAQVDSARQNLASSFVNGFVNAGFGKDKLLLCEDGSKAIYKNKEHGMFSTTASLGLLLLCDLDGGLTQIDRFMYSSDENLKVILKLCKFYIRIKKDIDRTEPLMVRRASNRRFSCWTSSKSLA